MHVGFRRISCCDHGLDHASQCENNILECYLSHSRETIATAPFPIPPFPSVDKCTWTDCRCRKAHQKKNGIHGAGTERKRHFHVGLNRIHLSNSTFQKESTLHSHAVPVSPFSPIDSVRERIAGVWKSIRSNRIRGAGAGSKRHRFGLSSYPRNSGRKFYLLHPGNVGLTFGWVIGSRFTGSTTDY